MNRRFGAVAVMISIAGACWCGTPAAAAAQPAGGLTAGAQVARVYEAILDTRFEQVPALLEPTCGDPPVAGSAAPAVRAPAPVCELLDVVARWWEIQLDPQDTSRDATFQARADAAVAAAEAWTRAEPQRAEAWFYLGGAYGARAQWRVLRGQTLAAARDGKRIKASLERSLALSPGLQDAYFGIGLYHYYADVAPVAAKIFRVLLLLPGGDKAKGLDEMLRARNGGQLLRSEADYQLHLIYLWYENQPQRALDLVTGLRDRHPRNPHFLQVIAEIQDTYLHDATASLRSWQAMLEAARAGRIAFAPMAEARARLGAATQLDRLYETDLAIEQLRAVIAAKPRSPVGALPLAIVQLGQALDRVGDRRGAVEAYRSALMTVGADDRLGVADRARAGLREAPSTQRATAYRLSLEGWRALERGAVNEAARALQQSLTLRPDDSVTQYRHARLLIAQGNTSGARRELEAVLRARDRTPPTFYASACVDTADVLEQMGERARAIELYRTARTVFGADQHTKDAAQRALTRLNAQPDRSAR